jgi:hypothetical protein
MSHFEEAKKMTRAAYAVFFIVFLAGACNENTDARPIQLGSRSPKRRSWQLRRWSTPARPLMQARRGMTVACPTRARRARRRKRW